jgi:glycogen debranching enzyme
VAASHFLLNQLPELYTASERSESNFPVQYLGANVPQAWAAGSVFMLTQAYWDSFRMGRTTGFMSTLSFLVGCQT